jgi:hypothetical protein
MHKIMMTIQQWLANEKRKYADGVQLYHKYKKNNEKDSFFNSVTDSKEGALHYNMLLSWMKNTFRKLPPQPDPKAEVKIPAKAIKANIETPANQVKYVHNELVDVKSLPPDVQKLYFRNQEITKKLTRLHQELREAKSDQERQPIASVIADINKERQDNWQEINKYGKDPSTHAQETAKESQEEGTLEDPKPTPKEVLEAQRRLQTAKINIARVEKELKDPKITGAKRSSRKAKIKAWGIEKQQLEEFIAKV